MTFSFIKQYKKPIPDSMGDFIEAALLEGTPAMVLGVPFVGKTTRVEECCKRHGYRLWSLSLDEWEQVAVGIPEHAETVPYSWEGILEEALAHSGNYSRLEEAFLMHTPIPSARKQLQSYASGERPLVLCIDEFLHRKASPKAQVAIYRLIARHTVAGVTFPANQLKFIFIGDVEPEDKDEAPFSEALLSCFVCFRKSSYDIQDTQLALQYMRKHHYFPALIDYLEQLSPEQFLKFIMPPGRRLYGDPYLRDGEFHCDSNFSDSTLCSLSKLSDSLWSGEESHPCTLICPDIGKISGWQDLDYDKTIKIMHQIEKRISRWAGNASKGKYHRFLHGWNGANWPFSPDKSNSMQDAIQLFLKEAVPVMCDPYVKEHYREEGSRASNIYQAVLKIMKDFLGIDSLFTNAVTCYVSREFASGFIPWYYEEHAKDYEPTVGSIFWLRRKAMKIKALLSV